MDVIQESTAKNSPGPDPVMSAPSEFGIKQVWGKFPTSLSEKCGNFKGVMEEPWTNSKWTNELKNVPL